MTHALAIARRDLADRTSVFIAAAVLAVVPFVLTVVPGMSSFNYMDVITTTGGLLSVGFTLGLALVIGVTMIGRDLSEKRMSFYFSKPISAPSIWFGKLLAAVISLALCFAVLFVPSYLAGSTSWHRSWNVELGAGFAVVGVVALTLLLLGHVFGTMFRSKSALVALDVVLMVLAGMAIAAIIRPLLEGFAGDLTTAVIYVLGGALLLILVLCGAWQLEKGRADRRQNHIALSTFIWIATSIVLATGGAFTAWVVHVSPKDLNGYDITQPDNGSWSFLFGPTKHRMDYHALFAYDLGTGEAMRIPGVRSWFSSGFSRDGRTVAYLKLPDFRAGQGELFLQPLQKDAKPVDTQITMSRGSVFAFSDDGARLGVVDTDGIATIYEIASKKALVSAKVPEAMRSAKRLFFVRPDLLRVYIQSPQYGSVKPVEQTLDVYELDARTRALAHTGSYRAVAEHLGLTVSSDGARALVVERGELDKTTKASVIDARTGQVIAAVPSGSLLHITLLDNDSVGVLTQNGNDWALTVHNIDGSERVIPVGKSQQLYFSRQVAGGIVVLTGGRPTTKDSTLFVVDYAKGSVLRREAQLHTSGFSGQQWWSADPRRSVAEAGQPVAVFDNAKTLYSWQPLTGAKKKLLTL